MIPKFQNVCCLRDILFSLNIVTDSDQNIQRGIKVLLTGLSPVRERTSTLGLSIQTFRDDDFEDQEVNQLEKSF